MDQILRSQFILDEFNHTQIDSIAQDICNPLKCNIILRSKSFENDTNKVEEWYQTKYSVSDIDDHILGKLENPSHLNSIGLPPQNILIPKNFDIKPTQPTFSEKPVLVKQWPNADLWFKKDDKFERPKCKVDLKIYIKDCDLGSTPDSRVFVNVWTKVVGEYMREFDYMANCASMNLSIGPSYDNIGFSWSGFDDTMTEYIDQSI